MSSYIGGIQIGEQSYKIGSSLYGTCSTAADTRNKKIVLPDFDQLLDGITIFIKFIAGNTAINIENASVTLQFYANNDDGTLPNSNLNAIGAIPVAENFLCPTNGIISFTLDNVSGVKNWRVNNNLMIEEGTTNGTLKVNGTEINIHGLGTAAYTSSTDYATSDHNHTGVYAPITNPTFNGIVTLPSVSDSSADSTAATVGYIKSRIAGLTNLVGAMHFKGSVNTIPPQSGSYESGDVVLLENTYKEYVYDSITSQWIELGDEGSFILQSAVTEGTATFIDTNGFTANTLPTLTVDETTVSSIIKENTSITTTQYTIPKVRQVGTPMSARVTNGVLTLTPGTETQLENNDIVLYGFNDQTTLTIPTITINNINLQDKIHFTQGTAASLTKTDVTVLIPATSNNS